MQLQENQIVIVREVLELMETCIECITYMGYQLSLTEIIMNSTIYLLEDVIQAFLCIKRTFSPIFENIEQSDYFKETIYSIEIILLELISDYKYGQVSGALKNLDKYLIPQFTGWYQETSKYFLPFIVS